MVLLTSSSISVFVSSGVVCLFTFLLFLSGYVLQQQTVRSIQAALHPPPRPTPTLPVYFQDREKVIESVDMETSEMIYEDEKQANADSSAERESQDSVAPIHNGTNWAPADDTPAMDSAMLDLGEVKEDQASQSVLTPIEKGDSSATTLAYVHLLSRPAQICSALLFFKLHMAQGDQNVQHLVLYPAFWGKETSSEPVNNALALMASTKDEYNIISSPVNVEYVSPAESDIQQDLLAHLATSDWNYDRMIYLRGPGMPLDIRALDSSLRDSRMKTSLSRQWARIDPSMLTANPSILLVSKEATYIPRGRHRGMIAEALTGDQEQHQDEPTGRQAAYVHFGGDEIDHHDSVEERYRTAFEDYERGRAEVCEGVTFENEQSDLRKKRSMRTREGQ